MSKDTDLDLAQRPGLPPALKVLLEAMPRLTWEAHPGFGGLAAFWMDRHLNFRRMTAMMITDAQARLDGNIAADRYASRLAQIGSRFLGELHGHHHIEDAQYFPMMAKMEHRIAHGFDLLEADHEALHELLARFADSANAVIGGGEGIEETGAFHAELLGFDKLLARHLEDEEDLVVPVILAHGLR